MARNNKVDLTIKQALEAGYCITSTRHRQASRIDRPDWREYMAKQHSPWDWEGDGMDWVNCLGNAAGDQYRRVYSNDHIQISSDFVNIFPKSSNTYIDYLFIDSDKNNKLIEKEIHWYLLKNGRN